MSFRKRWKGYGPGFYIILILSIFFFMWSSVEFAKVGATTEWIARSIISRVIISAFISYVFSLLWTSIAVVLLMLLIGDNKPFIIFLYLVTFVLAFYQHFIFGNNFVLFAYDLIG